MAGAALAEGFELDDGAALGKLLNGTVLGWHTIYVDGGPVGQSQTPSTLEASNPGEQATITDYTPNAITAHVELREPGWAVFSPRTTSVSSSP